MSGEDAYTETVGYLGAEAPRVSGEDAVAGAAAAWKAEAPPRERGGQINVLAVDWLDGSTPA